MANALINLFNRGKEALIGRPEQIIPSTEYSGAYQPLVSQVDFINQNLSTLPQNEQDLWNQQGYENIRKNAALGEISGIPSLQNASDNMGLRGGLNVVPATKGFLSDVQSGFRENANTPFSVENLAQPSRGKAFRLGEGLGTLGRAASSSVGRGLGTAALVGALGGDTLDMIAAGGQVALRNQQAKTQDQLYRKALEEQGLDTSKIRGYINENIYKNYSLGNYRQNSLELRQVEAESRNKIREIDRQLKEVKLKYADPTEQARMEKMLMDAKYAEEKNLATINALNSGTYYGGVRTNLAVQTAADKKQKEAEERAMLQKLIGIYGNPDGATTQDGTVKVKSPDGKLGNVPMSQLEAALKQGYTRL